MAASPNGVYALVDYVNFKGEGTLATERYQDHGWGLLQVLEGMKGRSFHPSRRVGHAGICRLGGARAHGAGCQFAT